jgi:hypothetical protein
MKDIVHYVTHIGAVMHIINSTGKEAGRNTASINVKIEIRWRSWEIEPQIVSKPIG